MKPQELSRIVREQTPLVTARMLLRPLRADDASAVFNYARDPEVTQYTQWDAHRTIEDSRRFIEQTIAAYQRGENAELAIELKSDKKVIGTCGLINISADHCRGELVFAMAKEQLGRRHNGRGTESDARVWIRSAAVESYLCEGGPGTT